MSNKRLNQYGIKINKTEVPICDFCHVEEGKKHKFSQPPITLTRIDVLGTKKNACQSCAQRYKEILIEKKTLMDVYTKFKLGEITKRF
tara:strand:- start:25956 stop:26219 length:264 start_codon:yes stop_codon:yes gene_type:complete